MDFLHQLHTKSLDDITDLNKSTVFSDTATVLFSINVRVKYKNVCEAVSNDQFG